MIVPQRKALLKKRERLPNSIIVELFLVIHSGLSVRQKSFLRISVIIKLFPQLLLFLYVESEMPGIPLIFPSSYTPVDVGRRYTKQTKVPTKVY